MAAAARTRTVACKLGDREKDALPPAGRCGSQLLVPLPQKPELGEETARLFTGAVSLAPQLAHCNCQPFVQLLQLRGPRGCPRCSAAALCGLQQCPLHLLGLLFGAFHRANQEQDRARLDTAPHAPWTTSGDERPISQSWRREMCGWYEA